MGTFKFTWAHPAEEVYVTGTFDNWTKSEKLDKVGDAFEKTVTLPEASEKIYYKPATASVRHIHVSKVPGSTSPLSPPTGLPC
ncbi:hypothetical protein K4K61_011177 [Colletotrichum sp. SAR11_59]|nr:hypothetical protein CFRS1_v005522 [Colletotrichum fructicola]KAI8218375.1 hypothetical protein K4K54_010521 [Colletotrichum sp. SAR 10_86]KAI8298971.1 hypothetical protein K4K61_011177 [Colletotrichum sp. SAR11_59]